MLRLVLTPPSDAWGPLPPHARRRTRRNGGVLQWVERLLLTLACVALGNFGYVQAETFLYQRYENRELDAILKSRAAAVAPHPGTAPAARVRPLPVAGSTMGRVEIPRLGVSAVVRAGSDARTLRLAVGYIPGTALPGEVGNVGLAGHRDTFFTRLRDIREDDEIRVVTPEGIFSYRVERTLIVDPADVWVLEPTDAPTLTLVTCYPFSYIGSAPQRFIVRATLNR